MCKSELTVKGLLIPFGLLVKCSGKVGKKGAVSSLIIIEGPIFLYLLQRVFLLISVLKVPFSVQCTFEVHIFYSSH